MATYSSDLAPQELWNIKTFLGGQNFKNNDKLKEHVTTHKNIQEGIQEFVPHNDSCLQNGRGLYGLIAPYRDFVAKEFLCI